MDTKIHNQCNRTENKQCSRARMTFSMKSAGSTGYPYEKKMNLDSLAHTIQKQTKIPVKS